MNPSRQQAAKARHKVQSLHHLMRIDPLKFSDMREALSLLEDIEAFLIVAERKLPNENSFSSPEIVS